MVSSYKPAEVVAFDPTTYSGETGSISVNYDGAVGLEAVSQDVGVHSLMAEAALASIPGEYHMMLKDYLRCLQSWIAGHLLSRLRSPHLALSRTSLRDHARNPARKSGIFPFVGVSVWAKSNLRSTFTPLNCWRPLPLPLFLS